MNTTTAPATATAPADSAALITVDTHGVARWELTHGHNVLEWGYAATENFALREIASAAAFHRVAEGQFTTITERTDTPLTRSITTIAPFGLRALLLTVAETTLTARRDLLNAHTVPTTPQTAINALDAIATAVNTIDAAAARIDLNNITATDIDLMHLYFRDARYLKTLTRHALRDTDTPDLLSEHADAARTITTRHTP